MFVEKDPEQLLVPLQIVPAPGSVTFVVATCTLSVPVQVNVTDSPVETLAELGLSVRFGACVSRVRILVSVVLTVPVELVIVIL